MTFPTSSLNTQAYSGTMIVPPAGSAFSKTGGSFQADGTTKFSGTMIKNNPFLLVPTIVYSPTYIVNTSFFTGTAPATPRQTATYQFWG